MLEIDTLWTFFFEIVNHRTTFPAVLRTHTRLKQIRDWCLGPRPGLPHRCNLDEVGYIPVAYSGAARIDAVETLCPRPCVRYCQPMGRPGYHFGCTRQSPTRSGSAKTVAVPIPRRCSFSRLR